MKKKFLRYLKLFWSTFLLSAFTFGGGYVIISLMKRKFVTELEWITDADMMEIVSIAQASPGAVAVNASLLLGNKVGGFLGSIVSVIGTALPPLIILSVISSFYVEFSQNAIINSILMGMQAGICIVIFDVILDLGKRIISQKEMPYILLMIAALVLSIFFKLDVIIIIVSCGVLGGLFSLIKKKEEKVQ